MIEMFLLLGGLQLPFDNVTTNSLLGQPLGKSGRINKRAVHSEKFSGRTGMHGKSRVSSAIKYDCFKLDDSGNVFYLKRNLG